MSTQQDNLEVGAEFDWLVEADKEVLQSAVALADLRAEEDPSVGCRVERGGQPAGVSFAWADR